MTLTRITSDGIKDGTISTADLSDQSVTLAKLPHGTSSNDGKFLRANNGADPTFESVVTDLVNDTSPQLGADLDVNDFDIKNGTAIYEIVSNARHNFKAGGNTIVDINGNGVDFKHGNNTHADNIKSQFGTGNDLQIYHDGSNSRVVNSTGALVFQADTVNFNDTANSDSKLQLISNGGVLLYYDNSKKFETTSTGVNVIGNLGIGDTSADFDIEINAAAPQIRLEETSTGGSKRLDLGVTSSGNPYIAANQSSQSIQIETSGSRRFTFGTSEMFTSENGTDFSWGSNPGHIVYQSGEYRSTSANGTHIRCNRMNGDGHVAQWYRGSSNMVGFISISSSGTSYGSGSSDERTKKNIEDWSESVLSKFKSLTPKLFNFNWEDNTAVKHKGYIAQNEVDKFPEAYPKNNLTDCDDEFYTFTPTDMTVYLMKGLKEAAEKIEILETKVAALEAS